MTKPLILVTNDDGITAPGIRALVEVATEFGEVVVVAPDKPQSGQGHAITLNHPIRLRKSTIFGNVEAHECTGTPVDCVKLAKKVLYKNREISLCVSGVNHGSNASVNIIYSGTMSAAMEASLEGINSIGFSLLDFSYNADFGASKFFASQIIHKILKNGMPETKLLNVNIPKGTVADIKGVRVCKQAEGIWDEEFQEGTDPRGQKYYWLNGEFLNLDDDPNTDINWLGQQYVTVVPSGHDLTKYTAIKPLDFLTQDN